MNKWIQIGSIIAVTFIGSLIYVVLVSSQIELVHWLNTIFMIALFYIVCSAGTVFIYSPPFQRLAYNFSYFFSKLKKADKMADEVERKDRSYKGDSLEERERPRWITSILLSGISLATISLILSIVSTT